MVRIEDGIPNYEAGIDLLEILFFKLSYKFSVLVYCNDTISAQ